MKDSSGSKRRYFRELIIMSMLLAIVGLTVAYATVNATLDIAGITAARVPSWNVKFISTKVTKRTGTAAVVQEPSIKGLNISYEVRLQEIGDSVTIEAVVKNDGNLNAKLDSHDIFGVPSEYKNNISYKITIEDGRPLEDGIVLKGNGLTTNEGYMKIYITITYEEYISAGLNNNEYKTFNLGLGLNFVQVCSNCSTQNVM